MSNLDKCILFMGASGGFLAVEARADSLSGAVCLFGAAVYCFVRGTCFFISSIREWPR